MFEKMRLNVEAIAMKEHLECISGSEKIHVSQCINRRIFEKNAFRMEAVAMKEHLECISGSEKMHLS